MHPSFNITSFTDTIKYIIFFDSQSSQYTGCLIFCYYTFGQHYMTFGFYNFVDGDRLKSTFNHCAIVIGTGGFSSLSGISGNETNTASFTIVDILFHLKVIPTFKIKGCQRILAHCSAMPSDTVLIKNYTKQM